MTNPDRVTAAARRALGALTDLIRDHSDPGSEALGARFELEQALLPTPPAASMSVGEAEAALAPLEAKVHAGREAQQTGMPSVTEALLSERVSRAVYEYREQACQWQETDGTTEEITRRVVRALRGLGAGGLLPAPVGQPVSRETAEAVLAAVEAALEDTLVSAAREEALAGIAAVLSEPTDQAAVRAAALQEAADHLPQMRIGAEDPSPDDHVRGYNDGLDHAEAELRRLADEQHAPTTADPIPLRWGLDDIEHGDDDTVTVLLSGPDGRPYWLELDPERANVLREALAETDEHPTTPDCPTPESHNWGCGCPTDQLPLHAQSGIDTPGCDCGHDGMGPKWHARACAWLDTMTVPHPDAVADEPAGPAAPAKEA